MAAEKITTEQAKRVLRVVNKGLTFGMGSPHPGEMCVEAAVSYALDLPFNDAPKCVAPALRTFKIDLNDSEGWQTNKGRANGLRRLAVIQLGSAKHLNERLFERLACEALVHKSLPRLIKVVLAGLDPEYDKDEIVTHKWALSLLRKYKSLLVLGKHFSSHEDSCFWDLGRELKRRRPNPGQVLEMLTDGGSVHQLSNKEREQNLTDIGEDIVQVLRKLKVPGTKWLKLTKLPSRVRARE